MKPIYVVLYFAAGGIVTVLDHLCSHVARSYAEKYPDPFSESKSLLWQLLHGFHFIVLILSFFLVLPLICRGFDIHYASEMLDKADRANKLDEFNNHLLKTVEKKDARIKELENAYDDLLSEYLAFCKKQQ